MIEEHGSGVVVALRVVSAAAFSLAIDRREGKAVGGGDELRNYGVGAQMLAALGIHDMVLLTNTRHAPVGLSGYGLTIVEERPISAASDSGSAS
jgi:3,4-dihydroxy 2-butanone 4-phosphate synthase/GTP cyclohydrolase II